MVTRRRNHRNIRERTTQLLSSTSRTRRRITPMRKTALRTTPLLRQMTAPRTRRNRRTRSHRQRPTTHAATRRHAATLARKRRNITATRHLHQHRTTRQRPTSMLKRQVRNTRHRRQRVTRQLKLRTRRKNTRRIITHQRTRRTHMRRPAGTHQTRRLTTHTEPGKQRRSILSRSTQKQHITGMTIRGALLHQRRIAVIPAHHQTQVRHRRVGRRAGTNHYRHLPQASLHKTVIASMRSRIRTQTHKRVSRQTLGERRLQKIQVLSGRNHRNSAATTGSSSSECGRQNIRPRVLQVAGKNRHHGAGRGTGGNIFNELRAVLVIGEDGGGIRRVRVQRRRVQHEGCGRAGGGKPRVRVGSAGGSGAGGGGGGSRLRFRVLRIRVLGGIGSAYRSRITQIRRLVTRQKRRVLLIQRGNARRHRQAQHVRHRGSITVGKRLSKRKNFGRNRGHTRQHRLERQQRGARPIGRGGALLNVAGHLVTVEQHAHAGAGHRILTQLGGHAVIKRAVHLRQSAIHAHTRHRVRHAARFQLSGNVHRLRGGRNQGITKSRKSLQQVKLLQGFLLSTQRCRRVRFRTALSHPNQRAPLP